MAGLNPPNKALTPLHSGHATDQSAPTEVQNRSATDDNRPM